MLKQKQRYKNDCGLAAIASLIGKDYDEVWPKDWQEYIGEKGSYGEDIDKNFEIAGLKGVYEPVYNHFGQGTEKWEKDIRRSTLNGLLWGRKALLQLPSLNHPGKSHLVAWDSNELWDPSPLLTYENLDNVVWEWCWIFDEKALAGRRFAEAFLAVFEKNEDENTDSF